MYTGVYYVHIYIQTISVVDNPTIFNTTDMMIHACIYIPVHTYIYIYILYTHIYIYIMSNGDIGNKSASLCFGRTCFLFVAVLRGRHIGLSGYASNDKMKSQINNSCHRVSNRATLLLYIWLWHSAIPTMQWFSRTINFTSFELELLRSLARGRVRRDRGLCCDCVSCDICFLHKLRLLDNKDKRDSVQEDCLSGTTALCKKTKLALSKAVWLIG